MFYSSTWEPVRVSSSLSGTSESSFFFFFLVLFSLGAHSRNENHTRLLDGAQTSMCIQDLEEATAFTYLAMQNISSLSIFWKENWNLSNFIL